MSPFHKEEVFSSSTQSPNMSSSNGNNSQQQQPENTQEDVFIDGPSINSRNNDPNEQEIVEIQIEVASSSESLEGEEQQQQEQTQPSSSTLTNDTTTTDNNNTLQQPEQQRKRRPSSPEVYGRKVTFTDNESSGISNSDSDGEGNNNANTNDNNNEGEENKSKTEPIKIPDRKSRSTTKRTNNSTNTRKVHSKKPQHLSVDPNSLDDRKMKKKNSMSNINTPHSLISPMSSHAFGFLMNAPTIIDQHNATTAPVIVESDLRSSMSETPSTIGSPSAEETKSDADLFEGNSTPKELLDITTPTSLSSALSDPFASAINDGKENIGRNIRDILKGMPSFEETGKRFIVVGLGYECHRFDTAQHMLDHITGEDQDAESFWIDCQQSDAGDVHALQKYFGIHGLTAEDMINNDSGEKWEVFDNYMFMIFTGQIADKVASNDYLPCHLNVLIFENCIITVHDKPIEGMDLLMNRIEKEFEIDAKHRKKLKHGKSIREKRDIIEKIRAEATPRKNDSADVIRRRKSTTIPSPSWVFYAYLDAIIDVYIPKVDNLTRECDTLDEFTVSLNTTEKEDLLWRIALNKRRTIVLRKLLLPKQKMITYLVSSRVPLPFIDKEIQLYLRDVLDHLTYCCDRLDIARDSLHQSHTNYLTRVQIEIAQNAQKTDAFMNRLTVFASIFGPLSVLSGIWGMNVKVPGQDVDNLYWFFGICAFMVILSLTLVMLLRKQLITM